MLQQMRGPQTCKRCNTIKYPGPTGAPENHKKFMCADGVTPALPSTQSKGQNKDPGAKPTCVSPEWPQPHGIFTAGKFFHPTEFLIKLREVYEQVVVEREQGDMVLENEAFISLLKRRTISTSTGTVLFKMYDLEIPDSDTMPSEMVVEHDGAKCLRMDCLRDGAEEGAGK